MDYQWIRRNREALGMSRCALARAIDVGSTTVENWEAGITPPSVQLWPRLTLFFEEHGLEVPDMPDDLPKAKNKRRSGVTDPVKLREKRVAAGLSMSDLAKLVGVDRHTLSDWERGIRAPSKESITTLTAIFKCSPEDLGFPRITNGLTVEERNALMLEYLEDINKACYGMRRLMYASRTEQEDARQSAALAVLEALGRADTPQDSEMLKHYIFSTIKGSLLQSVKRTNDRGFSAVPYGQYPDVIAFECLMVSPL